MSNKSSTAGGISFFTLLGLLFITLKLLGKIDWSWWWVTLPLWGGLAVVAVAFLLTLLVVAIMAMFGR
jgi:hypothetical protein